MAKKKKGKSKKGKKSDEKNEESEEDNMDLDMLREVVPMLRQQMEKAHLDRNYLQLERDTIQNFYDITKAEIQQLDNQIGKKDREMEEMEDNHRVEVRVYLQKVKHLEYEHKQNLETISVEGNDFIEEEVARHEETKAEMKRLALKLREERISNQTSNQETVEHVGEKHEKSLLMMRRMFEKDENSLEERCQKRLSQLKTDLELRRKAHIHEITERKNLHINDLMKNHEKAYGQMKKYYNDTTNDNLLLIKELKDEVTEMKKKQTEFQKLIASTEQENMLLKEPLTVAIAEVSDLRSQLRDREKDKLTLRNAKARLQVMEAKLAELKQKDQELLMEHEEVETERDDLYNNFETMIKDIQQKNNFNNILLEQRMQQASRDVEQIDAQIEQVVNAADLDPSMIKNMHVSIQANLVSCNETIQDKEYELLRCRKAFNDTLRTYSEKMRNLGVTQEEIDAIGYVEFAQEGVVQCPAGFVGKKPLQ